MKDVDIEEFFCESPLEATNTTSGGWDAGRHVGPGLLLISIIIDWLVTLTW